MVATNSWREIRPVGIVRFEFYLSGFGTCCARRKSHGVSAIEISAHWQKLLKNVIDCSPQEDCAWVPAWARFLYLAIVLDAFSLRIIGWAMRNDQKAQLVIDAMDVAVTQGKPDGVIHHSDQGSQ